MFRTTSEIQINISALRDVRELERARETPACLMIEDVPIGGSPIWRPISENIIRQIGEIDGKTILDAGCGTGGWAVWLAKQGAYVYAFDISPRSIEITNLRAQVNGVANRVSAEVFNIETNWQFDESVFDIVLLNAVLHHVQDHKMLEVMNNAHRVLKKVGKAIAAEPIGNSPLFEKIKYMVPSGHLGNWDYRPSSLSKAWDSWLQTSYGWDRTLTTGLLHSIGKNFDKIETKEFIFMGRLAKLFKNKQLVSLIAHLDDISISIPFIRRYCNNIVVTYHKTN
jgi:SAM-dependent methyltransferase